LSCCWRRTDPRDALVGGCTGGGETDDDRARLAFAFGRIAESDGDDVDVDQGSASPAMLLRFPKVRSAAADAEAAAEVAAAADACPPAAPAVGEPEMESVSSRASWKDALGLTRSRSSSASARSVEEE
jgi:hypothetical protein